MGGGQDNPAGLCCPPDEKITRVGGRISRDRLPPRGQPVHGWLAPRGATCPGGKINWDTGMKIVNLANNIDPDEVAHFEPPHLDLHCLHSFL